MKYKLESDKLSIAINKKGIELSSMKSKSSGLEYIWQANPEIWAGHAPVLFPIIGALKDGFTTYKNTTYTIPKHGLIRHSDQLVLIESSEDSLTFGMQWDEESLVKYPFKFSIEVTFKLTGNSLQVIHHIANLGDEKMLYSLGGHPAFNCPVHEDEKYDEYFLQFAQVETGDTLLLDANGLMTGETKRVIDNTDKLPLNDYLFEDDALVFKNLKSREVSLNHIEKGAILKMKYEDFDYLGIWAKPRAPFVCIEPWLGLSDSSDTDHNFENKEGMQSLAPQGSTTKSYEIIILE